jgi:nudix motif 8
MSLLVFDNQWVERMARRCIQSERILITSALSKTLHNSIERKHAAVLVPLCNVKGEASLLYTLRSKHVGTHKGQVSFPGGHRDHNENSIQTAIREFYEELYDGYVPMRTERIDETDPFSAYHTMELRILGVGQTIPAKTGTLVTPVIAQYLPPLRDVSNFTPNVQEVDQIFTRRVADLTSPDFVRSETLTRNGQSFVFPAYGPKDDLRIWGLTAIITEGVLKNLIIPTMI